MSNNDPRSFIQHNNMITLLMNTVPVLAGLFLFQENEIKAFYDSWLREHVHKIMDFRTSWLIDSLSKTSKTKTPSVNYIICFYGTACAEPICILIKFGTILFLNDCYGRKWGLQSNVHYYLDRNM